MTESSHFHEGNRRIQERFDTRRLADHCAAKLVRDALNEKQKAFVEGADMFFLATADERGRPSCSYKGGEPGFVRVVDERTLAIPNYDGDGKYLSWGNVLHNPNVAMLFIDFMRGWRLRVHGEAKVVLEGDELMGQWPGAQFVVRVGVREVFGNCPRYIHKYQLVERSAYVPKAGVEAPVPEWKKQEEWKAVLPAWDPARKR